MNEAVAIAMEKADVVAMNKAVVCSSINCLG
jgi:hypothetical protein